MTASSSGFAWSAASSASWLTIASGASGTGSGTIAWVAAPNSTLASRTATLTASGQTFTVLQAAAGSNLGMTGVSLLFTYQVGGATPPPQPLTVFSSGAPLNFSASAASVGNWLFVSPSSGVTSTVLSVFVNPTALAPGTYSGNVTVTAASSSNGSQIATVTLVVNGSQALTVAPAALSFAFQQGSANPAPQALSVTSAAPAGFAASASSAGNWLAVTPASAVTPSTLSVSVFPAGLAPGTYTGSVTIGTGAGAQTVTVTLVVAASQAIAISPSSFTFASVIGGAVPAPQTLTISGGTAGLNFNASASSAGNWLTLGASTVVVPGGFSVAVNPSGLAAGVYSGTITLTAANTTPQVVLVTLIVTAAQGLSVSPTSLTFNTPSSGVTPSSQALSVVSGVAGQTVTAVASISQGTWLVVSPFSTVTPGSVGVFVSPSGLAPGTYFGSVTFSIGSSSQTVPVTLVVGGATLVAMPASLAFIGVSPSPLRCAAPALSHEIGRSRCRDFDRADPASSSRATPRRSAPRPSRRPRPCARDARR